MLILDIYRMKVVRLADRQIPLDSSSNQQENGSHHCNPEWKLLYSIKMGLGVRVSIAVERTHIAIFCFYRSNIEKPLEMPDWNVSCLHRIEAKCLF